MSSYLCAEACHTVGAWAGLCEALGQQPGSQAVVRCGQWSIILQQVTCAAAFPMMQAERGGKQRAQSLSHDVDTGYWGWVEWCILHFQLLAVTLGQHTCVGEWEPATPKENKKAYVTFTFSRQTFTWSVFSGTTDGMSLTSCSFHSRHSAIHRGLQALAGWWHRPRRSWAECCCRPQRGRRWPGHGSVRSFPGLLPWNWTWAGSSSLLTSLMKETMMMNDEMKLSENSETQPCTEWLKSALTVIFMSL